MENINILNTLGTGLFGTTYTVLYNGKKYALKRQKILKSYITKGTKYPMWREFKFLSQINKFSENDKNFFIRLISYKFYDKCTFINKNKKTILKIVSRLQKSRHCLDMLFDLKDGIIFSIMNKLNKRQILSMTIQIFNAINIMHRYGYYHCDLHSGNIAYKKVKSNNMLCINKYKIPSYGYQFSLIDYGMILSDKFKLNKHEIKKLNIIRRYNYDAIRFYLSLTGITYAFKKKNIKYRHKLLKKLQENCSLYTRIKFMITSMYPELNKHFIKYEKNGIINVYIYIEIIQYLAIYDRHLLAICFNHKYVPNLIADEHIEYIKLNLHKIDNIIDYLYNIL